MEYILQRIKTLNEFCVICDERHVFECSLLKVCAVEVYVHGEQLYQYTALCVH